MRHAGSAALRPGRLRGQCNERGLRFQDLIRPTGRTVRGDKQTSNMAYVADSKSNVASGRSVWISGPFILVPYLHSHITSSQWKRYYPWKKTSSTSLPKKALLR